MLLKGKTPDVREMMLALDTPSFLVDISIPFVWFMPGTVDPDAASVVEINRAMQRGLRKLGYRRVKVNGVLDRETAMALDQISGHRRSWMQKTFVQILGDIISAMRDPDRTAHKMMYTPESLDGYFEYEGYPPGPLPGIMVGLPPGPLGMGATAVDAGVSLEFGQGIRNKSNIVPIPKNSGPTVAAFKNLQRQINRLLSQKPGSGRIAEDGIIGSGTFAAFKKAKDISGRFLPFTSSLEIAKNAVSLASILGSKAQSMGIPVAANKGASSSPTSRSEPTPQPMTSSQAAEFRSAGISSAAKKYIPFLLLAGGVAYYATTKKKGKGKGR